MQLNIYKLMADIETDISIQTDVWSREAEL